MSQHHVPGVNDRSTHSASTTAESLGLESPKVIDFNILNGIASGIAHVIISNEGVLQPCPILLLVASLTSCSVLRSLASLVRYDEVAILAQAFPTFFPMIAKPYMPCVRKDSLCKQPGHG